MRILVVIVESRGVESLVPVALEAAAGTRPVTLLQVRDPNYSDKVCNKLTQDGWLGAHSSEELGRTVNEDYNERFNDACKVLRKELNAAGITTECLVREGDLVNTVLRVVEEAGDVERIILGKPTRSWITRWFKDFNIRLLCDRSPVDVLVFPLTGE